MNPQPTCISCKHWEKDHEFTEGGWCFNYKMHSYSCESCDKHEMFKIEPTDKHEPTIYLYYL